MALQEIALPHVDIDLIYATPANITGRTIYTNMVCLLHADAAAALRAAADLAAAQGCRLRVYDAFRPVEAQWRLWEAFPDPEFVADPREGSNHARGVAVDLTLARRRWNPAGYGNAVRRHDGPVASRQYRDTGPGTGQPEPVAGHHGGGRLGPLPVGMVALPIAGPEAISFAVGCRSRWPGSIKFSANLVDPVFLCHRRGTGRERARQGKGLGKAHGLEHVPWDSIDRAVGRPRCWGWRSAL